MRLFSATFLVVAAARILVTIVDKPDLLDWPTGLLGGMLMRGDKFLVQCEEIVQELTRRLC